MDINLTHLAAALSVAALLAVMAQPALGVTLYVSPDGDDGFTGWLNQPTQQRTDGPLASLNGARDAVRRLKAAGPLTMPVRVVIADGEYQLSEPFTLTPLDSGTADCPIIYEAAPGARPVFSGGRRIEGFRPAEGELWVADVPGVAEREWRFEQLWVNGRRATRARIPNEFYYYTTRKPGFGPDPATGERVDLSKRAFVGRPEDIQPLLDIPQDQLTDVCLVAYHAWESSRHRIAHVDPDTGRIITTGDAPWPSMMWGPPQRYHLENFMAALDRTGEWYLDRAGTVHYWPLPGEDMETAEVVAPTLDHLVQIVGEPQAGLAVEHTNIRGLRFHHTRFILPPGGHGDSQAAVRVPAAIMADGARDVAFEDCELAHTGNYGIWFRRGCHDGAVRRCRIHDLGAGGVRIGEAMIRPDVADRTGRITVDNNIIHSGGRIFTGAVGVWIGQSSDNQVTHNDISDLYYTGISVGWSWGYRDTNSKRNRIEFNRIHHLGWGVMSDMGAVYTLGDAEGTSVSNNVIHDVWSYNRYGWAGLGLYNDEGTTGILMENNLVYNIRDMTYHQHYGRENTIRNNILAGGRDFQVSVHRVEPHLSVIFENNIVYWKTGKLFWQPSLGERQLRFNRNVYWNAAGEPFDFMGLSFPEWQAAGLDQDSVIADPLFVDPDNLDFTLRPDSPALRLGFTPFDYTRAGVYGDEAWVALARGLEYPPVEFAPDPPPPPPLDLDETFEDYPLGAAPADAQVNTEGKGDSIAVTDEHAASGGRSLKFTDAPGLQHSFSPHMAYSPRYSEGLARCRFDIRLEEGAELWHEYRDWSVTPYTTGPSLSIVEGRLMRGDDVLMEVPPGEWFRVEVTVGLGENATGTWELTVTLPGQEPRRFTDLPLTTPGWNKLTWVGFVSNAEGASVFYLDNIRLVNETGD